MASLETHLLASLFFTPIGIRRFLCSSSHFLKNPSLFKSKPWYFSNPKWKNLDLYILAVALPLASFAEIFIFSSLSGHSTYRFSFFQQFSSLSLFWILIIFLVLYDSLDHLLFNESFIFVYACIAFLVEYYFIGVGITGLGTIVYNLLAQLTLLCAGCCLVLSVKRTAFFAEFLLCFGLVFKGTWLLQTGLCLYTDAFVFKGCKKMEVLPRSPNADVHCELEDDSMRGVALVNLLFAVHGILIMIISFVGFGILSSFKNLRVESQMVRLKDSETRKKEENDLENPFVLQCHMVDRIGVRIDQRLVIRCQTSIDVTKDDLLYKSRQTREGDSLPSSSSRPPSALPFSSSSYTKEPDHITIIFCSLLVLSINELCSYR
ncbi:hypothetical protein Gogos_017452 [Gossypium gossypioides]|uniref:Uncharacterized protein n=1 Tax=Gossypium gossypioides TaxID=34282 RepID=A0A7J9BAQ4_GOSGO|nr:hypothetical protein [Gossypium gossypioides]